MFFFALVTVASHARRVPQTASERCSPVTEKLPEQTLRHFWHWFTVIRVGRGELEGQQSRRAR
jgi:hypothetical protein